MPMIHQPRFNLRDVRMTRFVGGPLSGKRHREPREPALGQIMIVPKLAITMSEDRLPFSLAFAQVAYRYVGCGKWRYLGAGAIA